ncbi:unnamed protein product [Adineta ricciae]|uniref:Endoglucanase n=1 Tax=Adineta ricciae TaxID=249248 RepID=A0A813S788_ADIRI|nr:unnamed protein product [Adineta ricciae]
MSKSLFLFLFMLHLFGYLLVCTTFTTILCQAQLRIDHRWSDGFKTTLNVPIENDFVNGWNIHLQFTQPVNIITWPGHLYSNTNNRSFAFTNNHSENIELLSGTFLHFKFIVQSIANLNNLLTISFNDKFILTNISTISSNTSKYDYALVLSNSLLFYEAQRSGKLPSDNRIKWRGDSMLMDKGHHGEDLTGGYFDAGDHVKFGFPMASFTTILTWGAIEYEDAYRRTGQLDYVRQAIRWSTDYFIKAHVSEFEFYGQVGDGHDDHIHWSRPEDWTKPRPAYKLTPEKPGSELIAETAAALAAASILFRSVDPDYHSLLLTHARQLYDFANRFRGNYSHSIPDITDFYNSWSGYGDELGWSAAWLLRATDDQRYQEDIEQHYDEFHLAKQPREFSWDDKTAGLQILMAKITNKQTYRTQAEHFCHYVVHQAPTTPKGLVFLAPWGSLRHASNAAFLCLMAAEININEAQYLKFVTEQINYILGDSGRSFVIGFGENYPKRPHHVSSSCPDRPTICDWNAYSSPHPNPQLLIGALVGGPDENDNYEDRRDDFIKNEVTTDYNAGFQSVLAGLLHYQFKSSE